MNFNKRRVWAWAHRKDVTTNNSSTLELAGCKAKQHDQDATGGAIEIANLNATIRDLRDQLQAVWGQIVHERHRVDILLAGSEGVLREIEPFHERRKSDEYQKAFNASKPLVSVLVATMNRCDLLIDRCISSIRGQSYDNLQIIVVGDHCTDDTEGRLAELRDDRICFTNLARRGPYPRPPRERWMVAGTFPANEALAQVEGDFITYLDDDDSYAPERIETLVAAAQCEKADLVWHPHYWRQADDSWLIRGNGILEHG